MRYLHDNRFKVITMADLGYDENTKSLYIKEGIPNQVHMQSQHSVLGSVIALCVCIWV
jgi:hypothetical protein